jgi:hypothetical protein
MVFHLHRLAEIRADADMCLPFPDHVHTSQLLVQHRFEVFDISGFDTIASDLMNVYDKVTLNRDKLKY